jgi:cellulose synthase/poly-beta-1,6-N-acetylglucosamine synthase-like glycosyltransferase
MLITLFYFFIAIVFIQIFYYLGIFGKFAFVKPQEITQKKLPVSVIVCAKNEEENVKKFIPLLAEQDYPDFEIFIIDYSTSDETIEFF